MEENEKNPINDELTDETVQDTVDASMTEEEQDREKVESLQDEEPDGVVNESTNNGDDITENCRQKSDIEITDSVISDVCHQGAPSGCPVYADKKGNVNGKTKGVLIYAGIISAMFLLCFCLLIVTICVGGKGKASNYVATDGTRVIFVKPDDGSCDSVLTAGELSLAVNPSVVEVYMSTDEGSGIGAGIIMTEDGYILTNYHVVEDATSLTVTLYGQEKEYIASIVGADTEHDVALLHINATSLSPAQFADSDLVLAGDTAYAIGHPAGMSFGWSITKGIVSGINRDLSEETGYDLPVIQIDTSVNTGNSGGPLLNDQGQVIGMVTMKLSYYENMGFAIPISSVLEIANKILTSGMDVDEMRTVNRPYLGISGTSVTTDIWYYVTANGGIVAVYTEEEAQLHSAFKPDVAGVWVIHIEEGSGAAGKLQENDVIVAVDGQAISTITEVINIVSSHQAGDNLEVKYYRDGQEYTVTITLTAR